MTKKDYESIARVIADSRQSFTSNSRHATFAESMAVMLKEDNPRFDAARFIMASMPSGYVGTRHANVWEREAYRADSQQG
jgi:hypothetical protein